VTSFGEAARERMRARHGAGVDAWWEELPRRLAALAERWELSLGDPIDRGNTSLLVRCTARDGRPAVLKLTPDAALAAEEARALRAWAVEAPRRRGEEAEVDAPRWAAAGGPAPAVWACDETEGALLLEAIAPGDLARRPALEEVATLLRRLHAAPPHGFPPLAERVEFIFELWRGRKGPAAEFDRAHALARELAVDPGEPVLLHGDLHPGNVLDGGARRGLVAVDPRACAGDPAFDAADWVLLGAENRRDVERNLDALAPAAGGDPARLAGWCAVFAPWYASPLSRSLASGLIHF
jgi:streptomycin 6-kinase